MSLRQPVRLFLAAVSVMASTTMLGAQSVAPCDWRASAAAVAEPWADNSRTFSKGAVRLALLDTIEPAAGAFHLLVLSPPYSEIGGRQCRVVSFDGTLGFADLDFTRLDAAYDPAVGLMFSLPGAIHLPEGDAGHPVHLRVSLNQATGEIGTSLDLGPE